MKHATKKVMIWVLFMVMCMSMALPVSASELPAEETADFEWDGTTITKYTGTASEVAIPETCTAIGRGAFLNCKNLNQITIPDSVKEIGIFAFGGCESLTSVTIPASVSVIAPDAFNGCFALKSVRLPQNLQGIGYFAFYDCVSLNEITIPSGVTEIGEGAFGNCGSLSGLTIPASVTEIGDALFDDNQGASILYVYDGSYAYDWVKTQSDMRYRVSGADSSPVKNLKAVSCGTQKVKLTWTKVTGADGYLIYTKKDGEKEYFTDTDNTYYEDDSALSTANNFYWVYPYKQDGEAKQLIGDCPNYVYAKGVCAPVTNLKAESAGKNEVKLTWSASSGAQGYIIYAKKNTEKAVYLGMTSNTRYTDKKALSTAYNFYFVYPYTMDANGKRVLGTAPKYVYAKGICKAVTNLKAASVKGGVKVTWTKSAGAAGYYVYKKVGKGAFTYIGYTTGNTYTDKKASKTQYNFYRVVPYHKEGTKKVMGQLGTYVYGKAK